MPEAPPAPAEPLSQGERGVVNAMMRWYREARTLVRHEILAGLAAEPDAVAFFRRVIEQGG